MTTLPERFTSTTQSERFWRFTPCPTPLLVSLRFHPVLNSVHSDVAIPMADHPPYIKDLSTRPEKPGYKQLFSYSYIQ